MNHLGTSGAGQQNGCSTRIDYMGWEKRGNREYYYRKQRIGGHVRSEYIGAGEAAMLIAQIDAIERERQNLECWEQKRELAEITQLDGQLTDLQAIIRAITKAVLVAEGFHTHKRQWRRKRDKHLQIEQEEQQRQERRCD